MVMEQAFEEVFFRGRHMKTRVLAAESPGRLFGISHFVVIRRAFEADAERLHRPCAQLAHEPDDDGGVEPAAQESPQRHVRQETLLDGLAQKRLQLLASFGEVVDAVDFVGRRPVTHFRSAPVFLDHHPRGRLERVDVLIGGERGREIAVGEIERECFQVRLPRDGRVAMKRFYLRRKEESVPVVVVEERFLPRAIAGENEAALGPVPDGESEHAIESSDSVLAFALIERENDLGVARCAKANAFGFELASDFAKVVHLAVEHDRDVARVVPHRLIGIRARSPACRRRSALPRPIGRPTR